MNAKLIKKLRKSLKYSVKPTEEREYDDVVVKKKHILQLNMDGTTEVVEKDKKTKILSGLHGGYKRVKKLVKSIRANLPGKVSNDSIINYITKK